jgi:IS30 family transposase
MTGRVDISERPAIADQKTEIGHWESDTMIGGNHLGVLVTYMDKASKFLVAGLAKNKTASEINRVTEKLFQEIHPDKRKTFTCDKVKEFWLSQLWWVKCILRYISPSEGVERTTKTQRTQRSINPMSIKLITQNLEEPNFGSPRFGG